MRDQFLKLAFVFDTLGDNIDTQIFTQHKDRLYDRGALVIGDHLVDKRTVDLDAFEWEALEIAEAGVARTEIVGRERYAHCGKLVKDAKRPFAVLHNGALGNLEFKLPRIEVMFLEQFPEPRNERRMHQLF